MRCGLFTRTSTNNVLICMQFSLSEEIGDTVEDFFNAIGFKAQGKDVTKMKLDGIKKAYK